jgi:predicted ATPase
MLSKLDHCLDFLVSRKQDFARRHRTLRATVAWSYELLSEPLQLTFVRMAIFRGGWTLEAAEAVADDNGGAALEELTELQKLFFDRLRGM